MIRLVCDRLRLCHNGLLVSEGGEFEANDEDALQMIKRGIAHRAAPPRVLYETKPARFETPEVAPETGAGFPTGDVPVSDEESEKVAAAGDRVLQETDVSEPGTADRGGRRKRKGHRHGK